ncbi:MAG: NAD-dependent epimerase/dehydratase family protein [Schwartzia sp. (in: firmicutes)]
MRRILVTGAHGFIGRYVARAYHAAGFYVVGIGHGTWNEREARAWGVDEWHDTDVNIDALKSYAQDCETIIHSAGSGSVGFSLLHPMQDFERTVWTTHYVLEYIRLFSPKTRFLYPSSAAVYGSQQKLPLSPDLPLHPISPYGVHKKIVEELCAMYARQYGLFIAVLRLFSVYGEGLKKQLLWDACCKLSRGQFDFWGTGEETRDWIHVTDVARAFLVADEKASAACPIFNVASGSAVKIADVLDSLFQAYGASARPFFGGEVNVGNPDHYEADIETITRWGWRPTVSLEKGIADYVRWYRQYDDSGLHPAAQ